VFALTSPHTTHPSRCRRPKGRICNVSRCTNGFAIFTVPCFEATTVSLVGSCRKRRRNYTIILTLLVLCFLQRFAGKFSVNSTPCSIVSTRINLEELPSLHDFHTHTRYVLPELSVIFTFPHTTHPSRCRRPKGRILDVSRCTNGFAIFTVPCFEATTVSLVGSCRKWRRNYNIILTLLVFLFLQRFAGKFSFNTLVF
jgi:hypothetical protein